MIRLYGFIKIYLLLLAALIATLAALAQETRQLSIKPQAIADLKTKSGALTVNAKWYVQPAFIAPKNFHLPGPQAGTTEELLIYPTGPSIQTNILQPQVGSADFENGFKLIQPTDLEKRQGPGLFSFVWYKVEFTLPSKVGSLDINGATAIFETVVDDYSEIWVNGKQAIGFGQVGNGYISGYNSRNRVVLSSKCKPGDQFIIYILGINGPIGMLPDNYIWIRNATIDFYDKTQNNQEIVDYVGSIHRIDSTFDNIISPGTKIQKIASGFSFTEGPVWHPAGFLLFSDPNTNTIYRYDTNSHNVTVYISHSGYSGADIGEYGQPGSNGLAIDKEGRLIVAQHGNRRIIRHEKKGPITILSDNFNNSRLNSPNDLVIKSDGSVYFTDPPYGLPGFYDDKRKELSIQGVYRIKEGKTELLTTALGGPNGIAFSQDEKFLYVSNWDIRDIHHTKTLWRFEVKPDGSLGNGHIFFDWNITEDEEALDGIKMDKLGNLFVSAPGGLWIINKEGRLLGKIITPERPANMAWGDDGKTLYLTAHSSLYKIRVLTGGKFSWQ